MEYPWEYCLKETGTITQGPNCGMVLDDAVQEILDGSGLEAARQLAATHRALEPAMRIDIYRRQFRSRPKRHFHYDFVESVQ